MSSTIDPYAIQTNQTHLHTLHLKTLARKYHRTIFQRPAPERTQAQLALLLHRIEQNPKPIILDSGCGRGKSSRILAHHYPDHWIIAVDQSAHRLKCLSSNTPQNIIIIRENCVDLWPLLAARNLPIDCHTIFYPNPWPKKQHEKRRWYAHPVLPALLQLSQLTIIRSNWQLYLQSYATVASQYGLNCRLQQLQQSHMPLSHFEAKYHHHNTPTYQLTVTSAPSL